MKRKAFFAVLLAIIITAGTLGLNVAVANPGDVTVEGVPDGNAYCKFTEVGPFWTSTSVGYVVYVNSTSDLNYNKTSDGGATWAGQTQIDGNTINGVAAWADWQTAGNTGTKIHIVYLDTTTDDIMYTYIDTDGDDVGTDKIADAGGDGNIYGGYLPNDMSVSITVSRGGNICAAYRHRDGSSAYASGFYTSADGDTWTSKTSPFADVAGDQIVLHPGNDTDTDDICGIYLDQSDSNDVNLTEFDFTENSWAETANISVTSTATYFYHMGSATRVSDNHIIAAFWNNTWTNAANDLEVWDIDTAGSVTQKTNIFTNQTEYWDSAVFIDPVSDDIYVAYHGGADYTSNVTCYYQKSTDGGGTWSGSNQAMQADASDDGKWISVGSMKAANGGKFLPIWLNDDTDDLFCNTDNAVIISTEEETGTPDTLDVDSPAGILDVDDGLPFALSSSGVASTIYADLTGEDGTNSYIIGCAYELESFLEDISGNSYEVVTDEPEGDYIYLGVVAGEFGDYDNLETSRVVYDEDDGLRITGKSARGVMLGVINFLNEIGAELLGAPCSDDTWLELPNQFTVSEMDTYYEPDTIFRYLWLGIVVDTLDATELNETMRHFRLLGAYNYGTGDNMYDNFYDWNEYYDTDPDSFLGTDNNSQSNWSLNGYRGNVTSNATAWAESWFDDDDYACLYAAGTQYKFLWGCVPVNPADGGTTPPDDYYKWTPYNQQPQWITDSATYLGNTVATHLETSDPDKYAVVLNYNGATEIPTDNQTWSPNLIHPVAPDSNIRSDDWDDVLIGLQALDDIKLGLYDVSGFGSIAYDPLIADGSRLRTCQSVANNSTGRFIWFESECNNFNFGMSSHILWIWSKVMWDYSLDIDDLLDDYCDIAYGDAASYMVDFYTNIFTSDLSQVEDNFEYLDAALDATDENDELARIKLMICFYWHYWQFRVPYGHYTTIDQDHLEDLYILTTKMRDTNMLLYTWSEATFREELIERFSETYPDNDAVYALQNFTEPTMEEALVYLTEGLSADS